MRLLYVITLFGSNQRNFFENTTPCNKHTLTKRVATNAMRSRFGSVRFRVIGFIETITCLPKIVTQDAIFCDPYDYIHRYLR